MRNLVTCEKGNKYVQDLIHKGIQDLLAMNVNHKKNTEINRTPIAQSTTTRHQNEFQTNSNNYCIIQISIIGMLK